MMPIRLVAHAQFRWHEGDTTGLPLAAVATFGGVAYLLVCPLCGCMHELCGVSFAMVGDEAIVEPRCLLREFAGETRASRRASERNWGQAAPWATIYRAWLKKYPKAENCSKVKAVYMGRGRKLSDPLAGIEPHAPALTDQGGRQQHRDIARPAPIAVM